ncbi:MAG: PASTA domain-containing protein [Calditrichaeota bacterium]|nr:MAG: PASTA domain-containing protein [Calditrichota bacterium]
MMQHPWVRRLMYILGVFILIILTDKVIMPWYVDLGDEIRMPDVIGKTVDEAQQILHKNDFHLIVADSVYDAHAPAGTIVEQRPYAFSTVKRGRNVYITVSNGEKAIVMPNLYGKSVREAEILLKSLHLELNNISYEYSDLYPEGAIIGQSFPQGQTVEKNTYIAITVSLGEMPSERVMPNLVGKSLNAARQQLKQLGVRNIRTEYEENARYLPNTILNQKPKTGVLLADVEEVTLVVSRLQSKTQNE